MRQVPSWNQYFISIAKVVCSRSKDPRTQVGAVIVDSRNRIIATGYNGFEPGQKESSLLWSPGIKNSHVVHAERNAIEHAVVNLRGSTLYVTLHPCWECAELIIKEGIKTVYYEEYRDTYKQSSELLALNGVEVKQLRTGV